MITKVFAYFDSKAAVYSLPFFMPKEAMALRAFSDLVSDSNTLVGKHPEDFSLFEVGTFNDETGELTSVPHKNLGNAAGFRRAVVPSMSDIQKGLEARSVENLKGVR